MSKYAAAQNKEGGRVKRDSMMAETIGYLLFLAFASACFYLFLVGMAGEFGDNYQTLRSYKIATQTQHRGR